MNERLVFFNFKFEDSLKIKNFHDLAKACTKNLTVKGTDCIKMDLNQIGF
jgi:hypothetical protein